MKSCFFVVVFMLVNFFSFDLKSQIVLRTKVIPFLGLDYRIVFCFETSLNSHAGSVN